MGETSEGWMSKPEIGPTIARPIQHYILFSEGHRTACALGWNYQFRSNQWVAPRDGEHQCMQCKRWLKERELLRSTYGT